MQCNCADCTQLRSKFEIRSQVRETPHDIMSRLLDTEPPIDGIRIDEEHAGPSFPHALPIAPLVRPTD